MAYSSHFRLADNMISHLDTVIGSISDAFISSRYVGFVSVAAVTVYELAIKEILCDFGAKKHKVLGTFTQAYFERINGRIKIKVVRDDYISKFGKKYVMRFTKKIEDAERQFLKDHRISVKSSYNNIIMWRNQFAHEGVIPSVPTYSEVTRAYGYGKEVIKCLEETMRY